jgi:autotransporter-associated beta strand protein
VQQGAVGLTLATSGGTNSTYSGTITGTGTLTKSGAGTQILEGNNSLGPVNLNGGTLLLNGNNTTGTVTVNSGTLGGSGVASGSVIVNNTGHIAPGESPGFFTAGTLTLNPGSVLDMELGSTFNSDYINVTGQLTLNGGSINVTNYNGLLDYGTYKLIDYGTRIGSIENLVEPADLPDFVFDLVDTGSQINLLVSEPGIEGDFNNDGLVGAEDYVVWKKFEGVEADLPNDNDLGGAVGPAEYAMWQQNFNPDGSGGGSPGNVPEPAAVMLVAVAMIGFAGCRRRRS